MKYIIRDYSTKPCGLDEAINRIAKSHPREAMCEVLATWNVDCNSDKPGADIGKVERAYMLFVRTLAEYCLLSLKGDDIELMMGCDMQRVDESEEESSIEKDALTLQLTIELSKENITDLIVTALEGGIGHWACLDTTTSLWGDYRKKYPHYSSSLLAAKVLLDGRRLEFSDSESGEHLPSISLKDIIQGTKLYAHKNLDMTKRFEADWDAEAADTIWQYGMFGELVYS